MDARWRLLSLRINHAEEIIEEGSIGAKEGDLSSRSATEAELPSCNNETCEEFAQEIEKIVAKRTS